MDLRSSKLPRSLTCPRCGYEDLPEKAHFCPECGAEILAAPKPVAAQIEVAQEVGSVEGGQVTGVDLGQVLGDVNIGNYTLRIGSVHGGVVNLAPPQQQKLPQPRPVPVQLLPRRSAGLLDRKAEVAGATTTLQSSSPAEFHGPSGIGKTELLRHLAYQQFTSGFSDGVVHFSAIRHKPVEDLLLDMFDAFYEREANYKPTPVQVRHALQDERALVILDDVNLERDEVTELMDAAPSSTFLLASTECCLWGDGQAVGLQGLPSADALALIERGLGRPLSTEERPAAEALCTVLKGHPLHLLQLATLVKEEGHSLPRLAAQLLVGTPAEALREQALAACSEQEQRALAVLAAARGATLGEQHVSALTGIEDIRPVLDSLKRRKLVQSHSPRYTLTGSLGDALQEEWNLTLWNERTLEHFAAWAEQHQEAPERIAEEADAILGVLQWALQEERWAQALRLGRAVEEALALGGQWGAWAQVLGWELQAAQALGDRAGEAWTLHQSGTRALCLEDTTTAHTDLTQALQLRELLGDWGGAAVTRHNLDLLGPGGPSDDHRPEDNGGGNGGGTAAWTPKLLLGTILALLLTTFSSCSIWIDCVANAADARPFLPPPINTVAPLLPPIFNSIGTPAGGEDLPSWLPPIFKGGGVVSRGENQPSWLPPIFNSGTPSRGEDQSSSTPPDTSTEATQPETKYTQTKQTKHTEIKSNIEIKSDNKACPKGQHWDDGVCIPDKEIKSPCPPGKHWDDEMCIADKPPGSGTGSGGSTAPVSPPPSAPKNTPPSTLPSTTLDTPPSTPKDTPPSTPQEPPPKELPKELPPPKDTPPSTPQEPPPKELPKELPPPNDTPKVN